MFTISGVEPRQPPERRKASIPTEYARFASRRSNRSRSDPGRRCCIGETRSTGRGPFAAGTTP